MLHRTPWLSYACRRAVPALAVALACATVLPASAAPHLDDHRSERVGTLATTPVTTAAIGQFRRYNDQSPTRYNHGDTYITAWAADGTMYITTADTTSPGGWQDANVAGSNLQLGKLINSPIDLSTFYGENVNFMNGSSAGQTNFGPPGGTCCADNRNWKPTGLASISGTLYMIVARYTGVEAGWGQNASIIKSTDGGINWTNALGQVNTPPPVDSNATFPGTKWAFPQFIQYGKDGAVPSPAPDAADQYVYIYTSDSANNVSLSAGGDNLYLARVLRTDLPSLDKTKYRFYTGGVGGDGSLAANWSTSITAATPFFSANDAVSGGDMLYNPVLGRYLMTTVSSWPGIRNARYWLREAPHPWGPWTDVLDQQLPDVYAQWNIPNKYLSADGRSLYLVTTNEFTNINKYCLHTAQVTLNPTLSMADDPAATYTGTWQSSSPYPGAYAGTSHYTNVPGAKASYTFTGTTVQWVGGRAADNGKVDVYLDGALQTTVDRYSAVTQTQQRLYSKTDLPNKPHTLELVLRNDKNPASTGTWTDVDAIEFGLAGAVDDSETRHITYTGDWASQSTTTGEWYGTQHYAYQAGSKATFTFRGTEVQWIGGKNHDNGKVDVSIDGAFSATIDRYSPTTLRNQALYAIRGLSPGTHTITLTVRADKNPASTGTWMDVDAFWFAD